MILGSAKDWDSLLNTELCGWLLQIRRHEKSATQAKIKTHSHSEAHTSPETHPHIHTHLLGNRLQVLLLGLHHSWILQVHKSLHAQLLELLLHLKLLILKVFHGGMIGTASI